MLTDSELLRRYVDQADQQSFADLVERHLGIVFNSALRRVNGNRDLAEEATQLVFTQLAAKASRLVGHPTLLGWLHTSTRFAASVVIRREQRFAARQQTAAAMHIEEPDGPEWETLRPFIDEALDCLTPQHRLAVLLRYFAGKSYAEVGRELRVSENAARKCIERAVENLRRQFARRGVTTSASALGLALSLAPANAATATATAANIAATASATAAAGQGTLVSTIIGFMTASKLSSTGALMLALVVTSGFGTAAILWSQKQDHELQQLEAVDAQTRALQSQLQRRTRTQKQSGTANTAPATVTGVDASAALFQKRSQTNHLLATDPAYAPIRDQEHRLTFLHEFGAFISTRNLSPEKVDALRRSVMEYYQARRTHSAEMMLDRDKIKAAAATRAADEKALFDSLAGTFTDAEQADIRRCFAAQQTMPAATGNQRESRIFGCSARSGPGARAGDDHE